jgi:hypothetical protein
MKVFLKYFRIRFTKQLTDFWPILYTVHFLKSYWIKALTELHMFANATCISLSEDYKLYVLDVNCSGKVRTEKK